MCGSYKYLASVYDKCMYDIDYGEWYVYIKRMLDKYGADGEIIETACGTGNITRYLAKDYDVIAVDKSEEMLLEARSKLAASGRRARLVCADMSQFCRDKKCSAVVCAMDGVNYLVDGVLPFFESAFYNLADGGVLVFDISSEYKLSRVIGDDFFYDDGEDVTYLWTNEFKNGLLYMNITMFIKQDDGRYIRRDEQHVQRAFKEKEIVSLLEKAGFVDICAYGFMSELPPAKDAQRIQFIAKKGKK